ncbi:MAG TPA: sulfide/dihydroorotate dehydrogenase-like FAD/NAD-binding protein [Thermoproteales archaeon]|nr:sulfide/dihydroorotate dehydrogenase-like FAD/NAD-binding protein [Thermoproteales archaeon]
MFKILRKEVLAKETVEMEIEAPYIARKTKPGQFVIIRINEKGERIPLTVVDTYPDKGSFTMVFKVVGLSTLKLSRLNAGDMIADVVGPLGNPTEIKKYGTVAVIGGGVGIATIIPVMKALKECGNYIIGIIGARSVDYLFYEDRVRKLSDEFYLTTDDGSKGRKGFVTDVLRELLESGRKIDLVYSVGPAIMMKVTCDVTRPYKVKTIVSLNSIMVDGTGMCGACRVIVGGEVKFTCVDGPEFDGHLVDFNTLLNRLKMYREEEKLALERYLKEVSVHA